MTIWQGEDDRTVAAGNAELLAAQWSGVHGLGLEPDSDSVAAAGLRRRAWGRAGRPAVELCTIAGMGHGFPVHAEMPGGGRPGAWVLEAGVPAARHIAAFWGIEPPACESAPPARAMGRVTLG
jgi:poly(3-hydroxybutyrate) depolymerase